MESGVVSNVNQVLSLSGASLHKAPEGRAVANGAAGRATQRLGVPWPMTF